MRFPRHTFARQLNNRKFYASPKLITLGLMLALIALALIARQHFAVTAQEQQDQQEQRSSAIQLKQIAAAADGTAGIDHHEPANSLLLSSSDRTELLGADGMRTLFSRLVADQRGRIATVREKRSGFAAGETFIGTDTPGAIARVAPDGSQVWNPWIALPGEIGLVRGLYVDRTDVFNGDLIAVTTSGGVWRVDFAGNSQRVAQMITARSSGGEEAPVSFEAVTVAPNDSAKYGPWAGKILAVAGRQGVIYAIGADGSVESFDLGIPQINNILIIPSKENFFGIVIDRQTSDQTADRTTNKSSIWGAPAADFAGMAGDFLVTQTGGEACKCKPTLWRARWNGTEFEKTKLAGIAEAGEQTELGQATFSPFGGHLFDQDDQSGGQQEPRLEKSVVDLNGGAVASGDILEYTLKLTNLSNRAISKSFIAEFIPPNVTYQERSLFITQGANASTQPKTEALDDDQVDAFTVGGKIVQINIGTGAGAGGRDGNILRGGTLSPGESNTVIFRVRVNDGLRHDSLVINGAEWGADDRYPAGKSNIVVLPLLTLDKSVTDENGGNLLPGDTLIYTLTLKNVSTEPVNKTFIAEFIPVGVTYVADSVETTYRGEKKGHKDATDDNDQVDAFRNSQGRVVQINIATGLGAGGREGGLLRGGTLMPGESTTATFRVTVDRGLNPAVPIISNGANVGANDKYPVAQSNILISNVSYAVPLVGPFSQPAAEGQADLTRARVNLNISNGLTTETGIVRFINTVRNTGTVPGRFIITAPAIPQGFKVIISVDSGATFQSLNQDVQIPIPGNVSVGEERNLDIRVELPMGLSINTDYDVVIQTAWDVDPARFDRTIDRVRPDPNPPNLALVKTVSDLNGNDLNGKCVTQGQTIEFTLTLRNAGTTPVGNTFIAEYLPPNVTYVAGSTRITAGPNSGAKTDARGDDQVDYFPNGFVNGQINIFTGTGATAVRGGTLAGGESTTVAFRVTINAATPVGTVIRNGADWGAEDFGIGGKSNIVNVMVCMPMPVPQLGPFGQPGATGNNDLTLSRVNLNVSGGLTTETGTVRFINTLKNTGDIPGRFVITAPAIPQGFSARISVDSGASFISLDSGGRAILPSDMNPGEERNLDLRVNLPVGLAVNTNYDIVLQAAWVVDETKSDRTTERVRPDPNAPPLALVKAVRDLNGRDISGVSLCASQTIEYTLTLRNAGTTPVGNTFIAEYLPPNVTYVAGSTRITAGPNSGAKTDARGDDQVDYFPNGFVNGQINIFTGTGATAVRGGTLAGSESTTVAFRVTINAATPVGTVIRNGADWGAEDFGIGGKSNIVEVTVGSTQPPVVTTQPASQTVCAGSPATFSVTATGGNLTYQWRRNGANITGATASSFTIASVAASDAGSYDVVVTNACGPTTSAAATLTVNPATAITTQPANQTVCAGQSATFTVAATGAGLTYQWRKNGANIAGATASSFTIASAAAGDAGSYDVVVAGSCGTVTSNAATLTVNPATAITMQPVNRTVCVGQSAGFSVAATGANLTYQWRKNGANIAGATSSSFSIASVAAVDAGSYDVVVTGTCGTVTSNAATLTVNPATAITTQPVSRTVCAGQSATFTVAAAGAGLSYQWRRNGQSIAGATAASFTIASAAAADAGNYDVVVTGTCGAVTSNAATLTVNPTTAITTQPVSRTGVVGQSVTFTVMATGANLTYQWRKNGAPIAGATSSSFTIAAVALADAGSYDVVVTGACGAVTSVAATLMVTEPPPDCRLTICFRSANYFLLNFDNGAIPPGSVLIGGVNLNSPIASNDPRVKLALNNAYGSLNREYVAAQLNVLGASGLGAANVITALMSQLRCYGLNFNPVTVGDGARTFTTESKLGEFLNYVNSAVQRSISSRDACVLIKLLNGLNGNSSANVCNRPAGMIDFGSCN